MTDPFSWTFRVADATFWTSETDGDWSEGFRWSSGVPPLEGDGVVADVPSEVSVHHTDGLGGREAS